MWSVACSRAGTCELSATAGDQDAPVRAIPAAAATPAIVLLLLTAGLLIAEARLEKIRTALCGPTSLRSLIDIAGPVYTLITEFSIISTSEGFDELISVENLFLKESIVIAFMAPPLSCSIDCEMFEHGEHIPL